MDSRDLGVARIIFVCSLQGAGISEGNWGKLLLLELNSRSLTLGTHITKEPKKDDRSGSVPDDGEEVTDSRDKGIAIITSV